jgi:hypothetical protein
MFILEDADHLMMAKPPILPQRFQPSLNFRCRRHQPKFIGTGRRF